MARIPRIRFLGTSESTSPQYFHVPKILVREPRLMVPQQFPIGNVKPVAGSNVAMHILPYMHRYYGDSAYPTALNVGRNGIYSNPANSNYWYESPRGNLILPYLFMVWMPLCSFSASGTGIAGINRPASTYGSLWFVDSDAVANRFVVQEYGNNYWAINHDSAAAWSTSFISYAFRKESVSKGTFFVNGVQVAETDAGNSGFYGGSCTITLNRCRSGTDGSGKTGLYWKHYAAVAINGYVPNSRIMELHQNPGVLFEPT